MCEKWGEERLCTKSDGEADTSEWAASVLSGEPDRSNMGESGLGHQVNQSDNMCCTNALPNWGPQDLPHPPITTDIFNFMMPYSS